MTIKSCIDSMLKEQLRRQALGKGFDNSSEKGRIDGSVKAWMFLAESYEKAGYDDFKAALRVEAKTVKDKLVKAKSLSDYEKSYLASYADTIASFTQGLDEHRFDLTKDELANENGHFDELDMLLFNR